MNPLYLQYIFCPTCHGELAQQSSELRCKQCHRIFPIEHDIPVLIDMNTIPAHLKGQISYFDREVKNRPVYRLDAWQESYIRRLEENFSLRRGEVLVDDGTGSGYIAVEMAKRGLIVFACDLTLNNLLPLKDVIKREHLENNLFLVCCTVEELPLKDSIADYLVSNAVLEHLPKEKEAITDIARVCKEKSSLMITVPIRLRYVWPIFWLPTMLHDKRIGHLRKYDELILKQKFAPLGYGVKGIYYPGHFEKSVVVSLSFLGVGCRLWDAWGEKRDQQRERLRYGSSNICVIFER